VRRRIRPAWRASTYQLRQVARPAGSVLRQVPVPRRLRVAASRTLLRRPGLVDVSLDRLLLGSQGGQSVDRYSEAFDDLLWASTPVREGPHTRLLGLAAKHGGTLSDEQILACVGRGGVVALAPFGPLVMKPEQTDWPTTDDFIAVAARHTEIDLVPLFRAWLFAESLP
jgi:hypothetical protein